MDSLFTLGFFLPWFYGWICTFMSGVFFPEIENVWFPFSSKVLSNVSEKLQKVDNSLACMFSLWYCGYALQH